MDRLRCEEGKETRTKRGLSARFRRQSSYRRMENRSGGNCGRKGGEEKSEDRLWILEGDIGDDRMANVRIMFQFSLPRQRQRTCLLINEGGEDVFMNFF